MQRVEWDTVYSGHEAGLRRLGAGGMDGRQDVGIYGEGALPLPLILTLFERRDDAEWRQAETFHSKPWFSEEKSVHGTSGPLHTEPHDLAPISELVKESMVDRGLPYTPDMFTTGATPQGCGDVPRTIHQGIRATAADFITKGYRRENITIKTEVTVDRVVLSKDDSGELTATGVVALTKDGDQVEYTATKEVIVSAGAYCSPLILMRSGIGAKEELAQHGIECRVDLPGVGKNLMDHVVRILPFLLKYCY